LDWFGISLGLVEWILGFQMDGNELLVGWRMMACGMEEMIGLWNGGNDWLVG
jgi:hypothetical protein